jgi:hypothetical protein
MREAWQPIALLQSLTSVGLHLQPGTLKFLNNEVFVFIFYAYGEMYSFVEEFCKVILHICHYEPKFDFVDLFLQIKFHENLFSLNRIVSHDWTIDISDC